MKNSAALLSLTLCVILEFCVGVALSYVVCNPVPGTPVNQPLGLARGIYPGRVVWNFDRSCCSWDGQSKWWFSPQFLNATVVEGMLQETMLKLTNSQTVFDAWTKLFRYHNQRKLGVDAPYKAGEKIAIKVNLNGDYNGYVDNQGNGVSPQFLVALLKQLTGVMRIPQEDITLYDGSRCWTPHFITGVHNLFPNVNFVDNTGEVAPGTIKIQPDMKKNLIYFSSKDVPAWDGAYIPTIVSESKYLMIVNNFRGHDLAGVTETGKNFFGSFYDPKVDCDFGEGVQNPHHWCPANLHDFVDVQNRSMAVYTPLVDFLGHPKLGDNLVVILTDGLYSGLHEDQAPPMKFKMPPFNNHWSSSIFASQDAIAMDSVLYDFLRSEPNQQYAHVGCIDNYLHEAALADATPSKVVYKPDGVNAIHSLGVHEHWNNFYDKQYSRNLGFSNGIELIQIRKR